LTAPADTPVPTTLAHVLGEIAWLMMRSPPHRHVFVGDFEWFALPALTAGQFRLFREDGHPVGVALWAMLDDATHADFKANGARRLRPDEWTGGPHPWVVEVVAPLGGTDAMLADLARHNLAGRVFNYFATGPDGGPQVATFEPKAVGKG
jgi:cytolysin-activating lysine-acyltransferase